MNRGYFDLRKKPLALAMTLALLAGEALALDGTPTATNVSATTANAPAKGSAADRAIETVVVIAERTVKRSHVNDTSPKLVYDESFFQRFEPISMGDMLKRVPGVTFNSDVGEYDLPRLRGLDSRYTQVLINGRRMPGSGNDGAIAVDRIPAELIEKIEIIRSPSSDINSQGIGGTLNIVLKEGATHQGGQWRLGAIHMDETRGSGFTSFAGTNGNWDYGISLNAQERFNPKQKTAMKTEGDERETVREADTRDSRDVALEFNTGYQLANFDKIKLDLLYLDTERKETEQGITTNLVRPDENAPFELDEEISTYQREDINQSDVSVGGEYLFVRGDLDTNIYTSLHRFEEDKRQDDFEADLGDALALDARELIDITDREWRGGFKSLYQTTEFQSRFGAEYYTKSRDFALVAVDDEGEIDDENDEFSDFTADTNGIDLFALGLWQLNRQLEMELGLRAEYTDLDVSGADFSGEKFDSSDSDWQYNPAAHWRWRLDNQREMRLSLARTLRRPQYDQLNPVELTIDDEKFRGNSALSPETSWGLDLGYDHFLGDVGVVGMNLFYREVTDLIEYRQTEIEVNGESFDLREPINNDNTGEIYGAELDISAPLSWASLDNVQWFLNLTYLDSEVEDPYFEGLDRPFSGQAEYVYNLGFEHELSQWNLSYGMSYQKQGDAEEFEGNEVNRIRYDGNLEVFIEKRFDNDNYVLRLSGQNLLDAEKNEFIREFDSTADFKQGSADSSEVELENTEPAIILTFRGRF